MEFLGTKKPWSVYTPSHVGCTNVSLGDCNGFSGYVELWHHHYESKEVAKANALLISKAPEMLEMLKELANLKSSSFILDELQERAKKLITKATELNK